MVRPVKKGEIANHMRASIVSIGDELVIGRTVDTNGAWLSRRLAELGISVVEHVTLGDDVEAIAGSLVRLGASCDVIISSGGLGPTDDDLTRHAIAKVLHCELELHKPSREHIEGFFKKINRPMPERNVIQAMIPAGCRVIENSLGTAPGIAAKIGGAEAFFTPGVPWEMQRMYENSIVPALRRTIAARGGGGPVLITRVLHTTGIGESMLAEKLGELMGRGRNPLLDCTVEPGVASLSLHASAADEASAKSLIAGLESEIRGRLGDLIFGGDDDTLAAVVGRLLLEKRATVAVAESCTGGLLAKLLTDVAGSSDYFLAGWVTYSNEAKADALGVDREVLSRYGAVSEPVACQLAECARQKARADYGLGITGIAGPGGGTADKPVGLVYVALADSQGTVVERLSAPGLRWVIRQRSALAALNMLRLRLLSV